MNDIEEKTQEMKVVAGYLKYMNTDIERVMWLRENGFAPYVMLYDKDHLPKGCDLRHLQRWVNNRFIFWKTKTFEDYLKGVK